MRIEYDEEQGLIVGFCNVPGYSRERDVVSFSNLSGTWIVGSSMCLPSNIESAEHIHRCVSAAFEKVREVQGNTRATSPAERQIEAIRAALKLCQEAAPYMVVDATFDLRGDIEKILEEGK